MCTSHHARHVAIQVLLTLAAVALPGCSRSPESSEVHSPLITTQPAAATQPGGPWQPPTPRAANERIEQRREMVETRITSSFDGRTPVKDPRVIEAMRIVPRHVFVPADQQQSAYADTPLPIGHDQTISQPYIVALMTELMELTPQSKVLEIGTGSGYQAAVLAQLTPHVYTIELLEPLARGAERTLRQQGYREVHCRCGDGYLGWPEAAPFDAMMLTCATADVPQPLWQELKPGGRMVMPMGDAGGIQWLVVHTKLPDGTRRTKDITLVRFVPLVHKEGGP